MLVKNIADHFRPRIQEHVITKRRRPIGNREPRALAGDEAADKEKRKGRAAKDYREPMGPRPLFSKVVWTGNKGNKCTGDIGNSFHGGLDWAQRFSEGGTGGPTRSRSFVIREM